MPDDGGTDAVDGSDTGGDTNTGPGTGTGGGNDNGDCNCPTPTPTYSSVDDTSGGTNSTPTSILDEGCGDDLKDCGNGVFVMRDIDNNCEFADCPDDDAGSLPILPLQLITKKIMEVTIMEVTIMEVTILKMFVLKSL